MVSQEELDRREAAKPEIDKLDTLEVQVQNAILIAGLTSSQLITALSEQRKIIELRSALKGIMPAREADDEH